VEWGKEETLTELARVFFVEHDMRSDIANVILWERQKLPEHLKFFASTAHK
jgi:hypothetical protein